MTDEPMVAYPLRDVLARIERDIGELRKDVHAMQMTQATGSAASTATTVADAARHAAGRARAATFAAWGAVVAGPLSAILIVVIGGR